MALHSRVHHKRYNKNRHGYICTYKPRVHVCGDYSVKINPKLEPHRYPMPLPEDLMRKLGGGYGFTKIDLADAYNQIPLGPISQKRLALSTNQGVLLQMRLPFGIISAPGYFQEIMDKLTADLPGVAVYLDDILVSGATAQEHLDNLKRLLQRLSALQKKLCHNNNFLMVVSIATVATIMKVKTTIIIYYNGL